MQRFNLRILNHVERKDLYLVQISNKFLTFENLHVEVYINSALVTIKENIKISAKRSGFEESKLLYDEGF
jgi:hypothetical protein